ncbi:unnamed protein product [Rhizoctonia solani]|uniref:Uncharacterized protein n=1 Tax=Rhizoctonia solani TaxID=456999 RepID=A0A8H3BBS1_9AGAM|nr:unnamed protein product [Rhizoctonia solani]
MSLVIMDLRKDPTDWCGTDERAGARHWVPRAHGGSRVLSERNMCAPERSQAIFDFVELVPGIGVLSGYKFDWSRSAIPPKLRTYGIALCDDLNVNPAETWASRSISSLEHADARD